MNIKIDPEFRDLIPPLSQEELDNLHTSISLDGCLAPLIVWKQEGILLDGHNRYAFCKKCDYDFQVTEIKLPHRESAINWIIKNQLGRRNVSPDVAARLRGMLYISRKKEHGGDRKSEESSGKSCHLIESKTREAVAKETGVSPRTIANDATYAEACDKLGITTAAIASGEEKRSRSEIIATAFPEKAKPKKMPEPEPVIEDEDDVECLVVDGTGEGSKDEQWEILFDYFKMLTPEQQQLLYTAIKTHLQK
jgi:ParB-like chromosome segregation protein Spo0J